jgi:hypothetical protein
MQPKYIYKSSKKHRHIYILVTKWKLFTLKRKTTPGQPNPRKTTPGQPNPRNLLTEEIVSYKIVVLSIPLS